MVNGSTMIYTHKPLDNSHLMLEESEDLENRVSILKNQVNEMNDSMLKMVDFSCSQ
jgi:hypothetical protein